MASEEPMFDPSLKKKKKKKTVAFSEDPLGAEADPTTPHSPTAGGEPELGPATIHEQSVQNGLADDDDEDKDDVKAMFGDLKKKKKKKEIPLDLPDEGSPTPAAGDDLDFSDLKKKKKKKEIPLDLPEEGSGRSSPAPGATDDLDFSDLKKKKKKKEIPADLDDASGTATPAEGAGDDLDFSDLKKKKKKTKKSAFDMEAFEKELADTTTGSPKPPKEKDEEGEEGEEEDLGEDVFASHGEGGAAPTGAAVGSWVGTDRDYTYEDLLQRFYHRLHAGNPSLASSAGKRYTLAPPSIHREGNKKTIFANVTDICRRMHRQPEHVIQFLFAEMGTTGSVDGAGRLVIKGRFLQKQVENVLRRYIVEYVTCKTCKSPDTLLTKENRIYFMSCESCGSRRSVSAIKTGFQAQVAKRRLNKTG